MKQAIHQWLSGPIGWARTVLLLIFTAGMIALAVAAFDDASVAWQREHFQKIPCDIESCNITRESGRDYRNLPGSHFVPSVTYYYEVNGTPYSSRVVSSRTSLITSPVGAEQFLQRFGPGSRSECYVNPEDPADAMLLLPENSQAVRLAKFGGLAVLLSLAAIAILQIVLTLDTAPKRPIPRAPGWGEIDSHPHDALHRTRQILRERLENPG